MVTPIATPITTGKFWVGDSNDEEENDCSLTDPRELDGFKISRRKGFQKDRNDKKEKLKMGKQSKTQRRNSKEPLVPPGPDEETQAQSQSQLSQTIPLIQTLPCSTSQVQDQPLPQPLSLPLSLPQAHPQPQPQPQPSTSYRDKVLQWNTESVMEIGSTNQQNIERSLDHANRSDLNPIFLVSNEAGLREEIVVELCTVNNQPF